MAVFTRVGESAFEKFAAPFGLEPPYKLCPIIEGIENTNYRVTAGGNEYVLTLLEGRSREFDAEILARILEHLRARRLPVPQPLRTPEGSSSKPLMERQAMLASWLSGRSVSHPNEKHCKLAGQALARLHVAGQGLENIGGNRFGVDSWRDYFETFRDRLELKSTSTSRTITEELDFLDKNWPSDLPSGLVHTDFFPDNLLFENGAVSGLLDFYYACKDFFAYDLAIALTAWCGRAEEWPHRALTHSFLGGYESARSIKASERRALPILLRGACLRFALTRLHDWIATPKNAIVKKKNPMEYMLKLETAKNLDGPLQ